MEALRNFLNSKAGQATVAGLLVLALVWGFFAVKNMFGTPSEVAEANTRWFIDTATGKPFRSKLEAGMQYPLKAPSGGDTGYAAELCYWTKDGKPKSEPTPVLLNSEVGKPGPTFCPDCGRLVVGHNPAPGDGTPPPPTQAEYKQRGGGQR